MAAEITRALAAMVAALDARDWPIMPHRAPRMPRLQPGRGYEGWTTVSPPEPAPQQFQRRPPAHNPRGARGRFTARRTASTED